MGRKKWTERGEERGGEGRCEKEKEKKEKEKSRKKEARKNSGSMEIRKNGEGGKREEVDEKN